MDIFRYHFHALKRGIEFMNKQYKKIALLLCVFLDNPYHPAPRAYDSHRSVPAFISRILVPAVVAIHLYRRQFRIIHSFKSPFANRYSKPIESIGNGYFLSLYKTKISGVGKTKGRL
jgi:hypothetical protein